MDQELVQYLDKCFHAIDARFQTMEERFTGLLDQRIEEVKRHTGILVEDLRYQVRLVAEGFATFVEGRYTQDQARIDERFRETQALIHTSFGHLAQQDDKLRRRIENLERKGEP